MLHGSEALSFTAVSLGAKSCTWGMAQNLKMSGLRSLAMYCRQWGACRSASVYQLI